ncbi:MAG TPA: alpha/beta hydrolase [Micromonosporaceae bacterium]|nr:alpha/beta hydrolase [Micromonosporaceae bacterium]
MIDRRDVIVDGVRIACHVRGAPTAPPMVLLHALGEDAHSWDVVVDEFARAFRVFAIDLRGHGESDRPGVYSFELMRDDVLAVLDRLGLNRVTMVGHSMGGIVAYLIAEREPHRIDRLILEDTPPPFPRSRAVPERPDGPLPFDWAVVPAMVGQLNDPDPAWWDDLTAITAATLLVAGGPESHVPQDKLTEVAARLPRCTLLTIPVGHHVHEGRPTEFASVVTKFLDT